MVVEQEAGYNAYAEHDGMAVISMSPELFLNKMVEFDDSSYEGTTKRGLTDAEDLKEATCWEQDPKSFRIWW